MVVAESSDLNCNCKDSSSPEFKDIVRDDGCDDPGDDPDDRLRNAQRRPRNATELKRSD